jgi:3-oxoadipate enol-lactonase
MPLVKVNDIEMYYEIHGEGPKLLCISGSFGDLRRKPNIFDSALAELFSILAFDQRGLGQTAKPDTQYSMADYANDAAGLLEVLGWDKAHVIGISFGGMVAQELAIRYPEKIEKLVIAISSTGGKGGSSYPIHELAELSYEEGAKSWYPILDNRKDEAWQKENTEEFEKTIGEWTGFMEDLFGKSGSEKRMGVMRQLETRIRHDTYDRIGPLRMPTLIIGGKYDSQAPVRNLKIMHSLIPGSMLEFFEGGHMVFSQDPEAYEAVIMYFLE